MPLKGSKSAGRGEEKAEEKRRIRKPRRKKRLRGCFEDAKKDDKIQMRQRLRTLLLRKKVEDLVYKTEPTQETARGFGGNIQVQVYTILKMTRFQTFRW